MKTTDIKSPLRKRVDELWTTLETHHGPSLTAEDHAILLELDEKALSETLTERDFEQAESDLLDRPRCYKVDHATGTVPHAYREAVDAEGKTNLQHRRSINGQKHISRHGRMWRVTMGTAANRAVQDLRQPLRLTWSET